MVGATFDGRIVGDNHTLLPFDESYASDDACRRSLIVVHIPGGQRAQFKERRIGVAQQLDALTRQQLVAFAMLSDGIFASSLLHELYAFSE